MFTDDLVPCAMTREEVEEELDTRGYTRDTRYAYQLGARPHSSCETGES